MNNARRPIILFIGGWGRSGSTLIGRLLGGAPGYFAAGELRDILGALPARNQVCQCGQPIRQCPFWSAVANRALGGWERVDADTFHRVRHQLDAPWRFRSLMRNKARPLPAVRQYCDALTRFIGAIAEESDADVVVDTTKLPSSAAVLRTVGFDVRMLHLVRDPRGVINSWNRRKGTDVTGGAIGAPPRYGAVGACARYTSYNLQAVAAGRRGMPYVRIRYEDIVERPGQVLTSALERIGLAADLDGVLDENTAHLPPGHLADGNPDRFSGGSVTLREDRRWQRQLTGSRRLAVDVLTLPAARQMGYRRRR